MLEYTSCFLQRIFFWDNPFFSVIIFIIFNFIFWWIKIFQWKFYGILFSIITLIFSIENILEFFEVQLDDKFQWIDWNSTIMEFYSCFIDNLMLFRSNHLNLFRIYSIGGSIILFMLGCSVSGLLFLYMLILSLFSLSFIIKVFPKVAQTIFVNEIVETFRPGIEISEEDLIPVVTNEFDKDIDNESHDADSCTNSFVSGLSVMPSYLEIEEGSIEQLDDDFEISLQQNQVTNDKQKLDLSDTDSDASANLIDTNLEPSLLNDEDSSSSDEKFTDGMTFTDGSQIMTVKVRSGERKQLKYLENEKSDKQKQEVIVEAIASSMLQHLSAGLISNITAVGSNLMSAVVSPQKFDNRTRDISHSSSESDFEIINSDDVDASS